MARGSCRYLTPWAGEPVEGPTFWPVAALGYHDGCVYFQEDEAAKGPKVVEDGTVVTPKVTGIRAVSCKDVLKGPSYVSACSLFPETFPLAEDDKGVVDHVKILAHGFALVLG